MRWIAKCAHQCNTLTKIVIVIGRNIIYLLHTSYALLVLIYELHVFTIE